MVIVNVYTDYTNSCGFIYIYMASFVIYDLYRNIINIIIKTQNYCCFIYAENISSAYPYFVSIRT